MKVLPRRALELEPLFRSQTLRRECGGLRYAEGGRRGLLVVGGEDRGEQSRGQPSSAS